MRTKELKRRENRLEFACEFLRMQVYCRLANHPHPAIEKVECISRHPVDCTGTAPLVVTVSGKEYRIGFGHDEREFWCSMFNSGGRDMWTRFDDDTELDDMCTEAVCDFLDAVLD